MRTLVVVAVGVLAAAAAAAAKSAPPRTTSRAGFCQRLALGILAVPTAAVAVEEKPDGLRVNDIPAPRAVGNARDGLDIDDALGFKWGGAERCDARVVGCGADGSVTELQALPIPSGVGAVANNAPLLGIDLEIGRESFPLRFQLLDSTPADVAEQLTQLVRGRLRLEGGSATLLKASVLEIRKGRHVVLGQAAAARQAREIKGGLKKLPKEGLPGAPAPGAPGLVSLRRGGLGERLELSFSTVGAEAEARRLAKDGWVVVGRVADGASMSTLARLDITPVQRSLHDGEPLIRTSVENTFVEAK